MPPKNQPRAAASFAAEGKQLYTLKHYAKAATFYEHAGNLHEKLNQFPQALAMSEQKTLCKWHEYAEQLTVRKKFVPALQQYQAILDRFPKNERAADQMIAILAQHNTNAERILASRAITQADTWEKRTSIKTNQLGLISA